MEHFESLHYEGDWGKLCSEDGELASVPDLVRVLVHGGLPHWNAIDAVLDRIGDDGNVRGYITHPHKFARPIGPHYDWAARFPESRVRPSWAPRSFDTLRGLHWLIEVLRAHWKQEPSQVDWQGAQRSPGERFERHLYVALFGGQFAIHLDDAHRLFKAELIAVVTPSPRIETDARRIFPEVFGERSPALPQAVSHASPVDILKSKVVPHPKGATWTEPEKQQVRDLRAAGVTDVEIAKRFDCERATLHQEIGPRKGRTGKGAGAGVFSSVFHMGRR